MPDVPTPIPRSVVQVPPADTPGVQGLLTLAVAVVIVAGLYLGREVMIPIILAVLLSFLGSSRVTVGDSVAKLAASVVVDRNGVQDW